MLTLIFTPKAGEDLDALDQNVRKMFLKHAEKLQAMPPRRHLKFGLPFNVEDVTKQARMIYKTTENELTILRCFATHKEYEKWFKSFK